MNIAIMQPYLFPYLGYYQLVNTVDEFVFFNDVNFIKKGWINRNQLLAKNETWTFTIPLIGASQNKLICDTQIMDRKEWQPKLFKSIEMSYAKAPFYNEVMSVLNNTIAADFDTIDKMAASSISEVFVYLGVAKKFHFSSELNYDRTGGGSDKIMSICKLLKTTGYINPENGKGLYSQSEFKANDLQLQFIQKSTVSYSQFEHKEFKDNLSMLDVLMHNSKEQISNLLNQYTLTDG
jgi:hypothetical protein